MIYAPFTDTTLYPVFDISTLPEITSFHLGFVVGDQDGDPSWGGYYKVKSTYYDDIIQKCKEQKKDLIVSFGGAAGKDLALVSPSVKSLFQKYKSVVDKYKLKKVDFDIEGKALLDNDANNRRAMAIHLLKDAYPFLRVSLTVPVMPFGLELQTRKLLDTTPHDLVNIMAMDFGKEKDMYSAVMQAFENTKKQTKKPLGITVMIGQNDTGEVFTLDDAHKLMKSVEDDPRLKFISIWSIERDRGLKGSLTTSSNVSQFRWEFSNIFNKK